MSTTEVAFTGTIRVMDDELHDAGGDLAQAVQDLIGPSGAQVVSIEYPLTQANGVDNR